MKKENAAREKPVPENKLKLVEELAGKFESSKTIMIVSMKSLPASQFQKIKKKLRGKADVVVAKKSIILRAVSKVEKGNLQNFKELIKADTCLMFSEIDSFSLASLLIDNQSPSKAKAGDVAPFDIVVEAGPTDLIPGPAISELGSVGLKVSVENGKLAIKQQATVAKEGEVINPKVASVLGKLNISPMRVGFIPVAAYDSEEDMIYKDIKIDKAGALEELRTSIGKALGFAINVGYVVKETISYFIAKAGREEIALEKVYESKTGKAAEVSKTGSGEKAVEDAKTESGENAGGGEEKAEGGEKAGGDETVKEEAK